MDSEGNRLDTPDQIKQEVNSFYQQLLGLSNAVNEGEMVTTVSALTDTSISDSTKDLLDHDVTDDEIKSTMFSLGSEKAPGPDSFTVFSRMLGQLLGVMCAKLSNHSSSLLKEVNSTIITLVPKVHNPSTITEFRPIACCNVLYKCITKILANRLRNCLSDLISSN
jgi:hypothetical protein